MGNDPNKKKTNNKINTTGSNYQSYDYMIRSGGVILGGKPQGSIVNPLTTFTTKIAGAIGGLFGRPTAAANRPGVKPATAVSYIKPVGIQPLSGSEPAGISTIKKAVPRFNPIAHRAKSNYSGWRPTSFKSIMGGFSGIITPNANQGVRDLTTGVVGMERFATFGQTGARSLSEVRPGENMEASGWRKFGGFVSINQGDTKGYSINKLTDVSANTHKNIFRNIIQSQTGTGYMGSNFIGTTGRHSSPSSNSYKLSDVGTGKSLFIQHANQPQFLHETLSSISSAFKNDKPTYNVSTSSGAQTRKTGSHALSADYEVYKSYMDTYFSSTGKLGGGYTTEKPSKQNNLFTDSRRSGLGVSEYGYSNMIKSYNQRTKSGQIPTISDYSMNLVGYDILKPPGKK